jgi:hypothetical protein
VTQRVTSSVADGEVLLNHTLMMPLQRYIFH